MVADKGKKLKATEKEDAVNVEQVDGDLVFSVEKLQEIQDELDKINEEASEKILKLEQQYCKLRKPVYSKRNEIIQSIPDFWLTAFLSHPALSDCFNEEDKKILKYLTSLEVEESGEVESGFSINFNFKPNPYFENTTISKTYSFVEEEQTTKITATPIKWKEGMGIPNGVTHEKEGNKRPHDEDSFFTWFVDSEHSDDDTADEIAEVIKEDLWPNPLCYFNNDAETEDEVSDGEDDDEDDDEAEEEDGDDQDNEENGN